MSTDEKVNVMMWVLIWIPLALGGAGLLFALLGPLFMGASDAGGKWAFGRAARKYEAIGDEDEDEGGV